MQQMGGMSGLMGMLPGVAKMKNQLASANLDERLLKRQMAAIDSMTPKERKNPDVLKASRKKRIASGAGVKVEDINRMLKMHRTMADVMKSMGSGKRGGPMAGIANMLGLGGGGADALAGADGGTGEENARRRGRTALEHTGPADAMPGLPPKFPGSGPLLPGLGAKPGLGGFPGLGKKK